MVNDDRRGRISESRTSVRRGKQVGDCDSLSSEKVYLAICRELSLLDEV